jgi:hypothetical protein
MVDIGVRTEDPMLRGCESLAVPSRWTLGKTFFGYLLLHVTRCVMSKGQPESKRKRLFLLHQNL